MIPSIHHTHKKKKKPRQFLGKNLEFEIQCLSICLHASDVLECAYDSNMKLYNDSSIGLETLR